MMAKQRPEAAAQEEVAKAARELSGIKYWLKRTLSTLPEARRPHPDSDPDVATELRAAIGCVIVDSLEPAIEDLEAAAHYRPERPARKRPARQAAPEIAGESAAETTDSQEAARAPQQEGEP